MVNLEQKSKREIKKLLIDALAFLKVEAYIGIYESCKKAMDIVDEINYEKTCNEYEEDEDEHDSSF